MTIALPITENTRGWASKSLLWTLEFPIWLLQFGLWAGKEKIIAFPFVLILLNKQTYWNQYLLKTFV